MPLQDDAVRGEGVDVRRLRERVVEPNIVVAQIVSQHHDDVGQFLLLGSTPHAQKQQQAKNRHCMTKVIDLASDLWTDILVYEY